MCVCVHTRMCVSVWMWVGVSIRITSVSYIMFESFCPSPPLYSYEGPAYYCYCVSHSSCLWGSVEEYGPEYESHKLQCL